MGKLIEGEWDPTPARGHDTQDEFSARIHPPGEENGSSPQYPAASGRYHLYISRACPWAHRAALVRRLRGLEDHISLDVVDPVREDAGWRFRTSKDGCTEDTATGASYLRDVYVESDPTYTGRVTVPVLYDTRTEQIVNNESADIARMLDTAFDSFATRDGRLYPVGERERIDRIAERVHTTTNLKVYEAGFAASQTEYETAVYELFDALAEWDERLAEQRFLAGDHLTLADVFLFPTLFRFDAVYYPHFKCNFKRLTEFENLGAYARDLYQLSGVKPTCNLTHIKAHYYRSHEDLNPSGLVPVGPASNWSQPHDRATLSGQAPVLAQSTPP